MSILFCSDDLNPRTIDCSFAHEAAAASRCGLQYELIDLTALRRADENEALRFIARRDRIENEVYRGWMATPDEYRFLYSALKRRCVRLVNSPDEYVHCHWFPNSYPVIKEHTPHSVWLPLDEGLSDFTRVMSVLSEFRSSAVVVKDYVKSRKHEWLEACFIPDASDESHVRSVVERFIELQGEDLQGGLVFREFVEFERVGTHPKSGMPLTLEYRLFVFDGTVIAECPYWDAEYNAERPPVAQFAAVLKNIQSRFFTCDIAKTVGGRWLVVELGDGQVAGLPERCDVTRFYERLSEGLNQEAVS